MRVLRAPDDPEATLRIRISSKVGMLSLEINQQLSLSLSLLLVITWHGGLSPDVFELLLNNIMFVSSL